jgi:hypothetical protein
MFAQMNALLSGVDQNKPDGTCIFVLLCPDCFQMQVMVSLSLSAKSTHTKEAHRKTVLRAHHHQECILDYQAKLSS